MNKIYCPRCGHVNKPSARFCQNCGYDLSQARPVINNESNRQIMPNYYGSTEPYGHHHAVLSIIFILLISAVVFGGVYTYNNGSYPFGNSPLGRVSNQKPYNNQANYTTVKELWNCVNVKMGATNSGNSNYTNLFKNGSNNKAYKIMTQWCRITNQADHNNDTQVARITPYDFTHLSNNRVGYKVRYDFKTGSHHHIQVFKWRTKIQNGKIVSMWNNE